MSNSEPEPTWGVALFHSVHGALGAEKVLESAAISFKLIAVPRHLGSNCGFCLRFDWASKAAVEEALAKVELGLERIVPL